MGVQRDFLSHCRFRLMAESADWNKRTCTDGRLSVLDEPASQRMQEPLLPPSAFEHGVAHSTTTSNLSRHPQDPLLNQPPCPTPGQTKNTGFCDQLGLLNDPTATREQHVCWDLKSAVNVGDTEVAPWKTAVGCGGTFPAAESFAVIGTKIMGKPAWKTSGWSDGERLCVLGSELERERKAREKAEKSCTKALEKNEEAARRNMDVEKRLAVAEKKVQETEELCVKAERRCAEADERCEAAEGKLEPLQTELENQRAKHQKERSHFESELQLAENSRVQMQLQLEQQQQTHLAEVMDKEREALALRVDTLSDILAVQEDMLTQAKRLPAHIDSDATGAEALLMHWRKKVFSLMVQLKSLQLSQKEEEAKHEAQKQALQVECNRVQKELQLMQISLNDRDAQVQLLGAKVQTLCADLSVTQAAVGHEEECRRRAESALQRLCDLAKRSHQVIVGKEEALGIALEHLAGLQSRVAFAGSRLGILQGLFARREAFVKLEVQSRLKSHAHIDEDDGDMERVSRAELQNLLGEREHLATRMKRDAAAIESRIARARQDAEEELHEVKTKAVTEGRRADETQKEADALTWKLKEAQKELQSAQQALSRQEHDLQAQHTAELARMDTLLKQARREHSKAVMATCQAERRASRERERVEVELSTLRRQMKWNEPDLTEHLQDSQIDRGLLTQCTGSKPAVVPLRTEHQPTSSSLPFQQGTCKDRWL
uniref:Coiled-coil alpha-helical rod protein 1 n=1 Tax=Eptatretus burgeri TaxID=7764 RepID=A0A8C4N342_EPTBU